jgi:hypothetical protein
MFIDKFEKAPCIWVYRNSFDPGNFVEMVEEEAEKSWPHLSWVSSQTGGNSSSGNSVNTYRTSMEMALAPILSETVIDELIPMRKHFVDEIFHPIDSCVIDYREAFELPLRMHTGWQMLKYLHGGEYRTHHDHHSENGRILSVVSSLGSDCEGGELEFPIFDTKIKLNAGDTALFPSNFPYMHAAHPVLSGTKYSLVSWFV